MSVMSDLNLGIYVYNDKKDKQTYSDSITSHKKNSDTSVVDETVSAVNSNTNCIESAENLMLEALFKKARECNIEVCIEPEPKYETELRKCIETEKDIIRASMPAITAGVKMLAEQEKNSYDYQPVSIDMKMVERKYNLRQTLKKNPKKNQGIVDFCHSISATPQSANSFKHIYSMKRSERDIPNLMLFYNQNVNLDTGTNFRTAKIGFEDIRTITFHTYLDWYVTKNSFVGNIRKSENLFSFDNIVIDVDNHSDNIKVRILNGEIKKLITCLKAKELDFPEFNFVYTGRGVQIWIGLVSFTARKDKMKRLYTVFCEKLCDIVKKAIKDNSFNLQVDEGASKDMCRFVRLPFTTNTKVHRKTEFVKFTDKRYTVDELCSRFGFKRADNDRKKEAVTPKKRGIDYNRGFAPLFVKRMNFIEKIVADCNGNCVGRREILLFHYFNVCRQIFDDEKAVEMTQQLNVRFSEPLQMSALGAIFREKIYQYKGDTFLSGINATFEEQQLYLSTTGRQSERDKAKKAKKERNSSIIKLFKQGYTQRQIADKVGCHAGTVANVLKSYRLETEQGTVEKTGGTKKTTLRKDVQKSTIRLYEQGYKQKEIAKKLDVAESTVSDILKPYKKNKVSPRDCKIIELSQQGCTQQQIADMVGCGKSTVIRVLKNYKAKDTVPAEDKPVVNSVPSEENVSTDEEYERVLNTPFKQLTESELETGGLTKCLALEDLRKNRQILMLSKIRHPKNRTSI